MKNNRSLAGLCLLSIFSIKSYGQTPVLPCPISVTTTPIPVPASWRTNGDHIVTNPCNYRTNVGIGLDFDLPQERLHVGGNGLFNGVLHATEGIFGGPRFTGGVNGLTAPDNSLYGTTYLGQPNRHVIITQGLESYVINYNNQPQLSKTFSNLKI